MRTALWLGLVAVCVSPAGCSLFNKNKRAAANDAAPRPFLGADPGPRPTATAAADPAAPPSGLSGILAGQVLDRFNRRQPGSFIQVVDLSDVKGNAAKIEVATDNQGYFTIQGLQPGRNYQLIARTREGDRVLSGVTLAQPPNPRLSIYISDEFTSPSTPPVPPPPGLPDKSAEAKPASPAASLDRPTPAGSDPAPPPPDAPAAANPSLDPSRIAGVEGFARAPAANVPGPTARDGDPAVLPPPPPLPPPTGPGAPFAAADPSGAASTLPPPPSPVPFCVLVGRRLDNFALYGLDGLPWEYRRHRTGRLTLIDFWYSSCGPCLQAIPHLVQLQRQYQPYGLEVVGIAYERGKMAEQVQKVRAVRGRYTVNYTTLLGGGGPGPCPVRTQFEVNAFPTLILLDETGQIVWRSEGLDARQLWELEIELRRRLGIRTSNQ